MTKVLSQQPQTAKDAAEHPPDHTPLIHELTQIQGVGVARKRWLAALNICSVADLAQATADDLVAQLKQQGYTVPLDTVKQWIAQAQAITMAAPSEQLQRLESLTAPEVPSWSAPSQSNGDPVTEATIAPIAPRSLASQPEATSHAADWSDIANFSIAFQTRLIHGRVEQRTEIRHQNTAATEAWDGIRGDGLSAWMLRRIPAHFQRQVKGAEPDVIPLPKLLTPSAPIGVKITQLQVYQPHQAQAMMTVDRTQPLFAGPLSAHMPFDLKVSFRLQGEALSELTNELLSYQIQCHGRQLTNGSMVHLGDRQANLWIGAGDQYTALFPHVVIPEAGAYRLQVLVALQNLVAVPAFFEVALVQVVG